MGSVHHTLRLDFEHWLNQVARIEQDDGSAPKPDRPAPAPAPATGGDADFANALQAGEEQLLWRAVRSSIVAQSGLRDQIGALVEHIKGDRFARQAEMDIVRGILQRNTEAMGRQTALLGAMLVQQGGAVPSLARRKKDRAAADVTMQDWIDATAPSDEGAADEGKKRA